MNELRRRAIALAKAKRIEELNAYLEFMGELNRILDTLQGDVQDLKTRLGALSSHVTGLIGQETAAMVEPIALQVEALAADVATLAARVGALEERAVGDPQSPRSLGGEG